MQTIDLEAIILRKMSQSITSDGGRLGVGDRFTYVERDAANSGNMPRRFSIAPQVLIRTRAAARPQPAPPGRQPLVPQPVMN